MKREPPYRLALTALLLTALHARAHGESVTLTTSYPAPSGVYARMTVTSTTYLARDGGSVGSQSIDS